MEFWRLAASNSIINVTLLAWFVAQSSKVIIILVTTKKVDVRRFIGSGGMPSSHAATVSALAACIARVEGIASPLFAACVIIALIVMYDASGVRRAAGNQAEIINRMLENWDTDDPYFMETKLKEFIGHTPVQVWVGAALGVWIGCVAVL